MRILYVRGIYWKRRIPMNNKLSVGIWLFYYVFLFKKKKRLRVYVN